MLVSGYCGASDCLCGSDVAGMAGEAHEADRSVDVLAAEQRNERHEKREAGEEVMRPNVKKLQGECDKFNDDVKVGDEVFVKLDGVDEPFKTRTKSEAQILSGHSAVIWLVGVSGCYLLDRVRKA